MIETSSKRLLFITGCQRSGTTLLHLVLDSHPAIRSVDEADYWKQERPVDDYLADPSLPPSVAFKLPQEACHLEPLLEKHPGARVLWCLRDPRDVVASMVALVLRHGAPSPLVWAAHPNGALHELDRAIPALPEELRARLAPHLERYATLGATAPENRKRADAIFTGALCWRVKNEFLSLHRRRRRGLPLEVVRYEEIVTTPRECIAALLSALDLPWSEEVLRHHLLHSGILIGRTDASRAIDDTKVGRFAQELSPGELESIRQVTSELAAELGYVL